MTATPVINELREGVSLLEVVTRKRHDLTTRRRGDGAVMDALSLHFALMQNGLRYSPQYRQALSIKVQPVNDDNLLPSLQTVATSTADVLSIERTLLPVKLDAVRESIKPGTVIYLEFVEVFGSAGASFCGIAGCNPLASISATQRPWNVEVSRTSSFRAKWTS
jgi:hypothetical protein